MPQRTEHGSDITYRNVQGGVTIASPCAEAQPTIQPSLYPDQLALVSRLSSGDPDAFRLLDEMYRHRLYRFAMRIMKSPQDAEDAVQDAFFRAFLKFDTFHNRSSIYTWLISIVANCCLAHLRKNKKHLVSQSLDEHGFGEEPRLSLVASNQRSSEEELIEAEQMELLRQAIKCLRVDFRFILNARTERSMSLEQVALELRLSLPATKSRALRARRQLVRDARSMIGREMATDVSQSARSMLPMSEPS